MTNREQSQLILLETLADIAFRSCVVPLLFSFPWQSFQGIDGPATGKITFTSDRQRGEARHELRKRKKLLFKGKLISGHFVPTRSQPSSNIFFTFHLFSCFYLPLSSILAIYFSHYRCHYYSRFSSLTSVT